MCKNLAERRWSPGHQRWVLASANTPVFYLQSPSSQGWLCFLGTSVNLRQKRMICPSFSENSLRSPSVYSHGLSSKAGRSFIPLIPWRSYAFWVTMTILKHAVLFWNTTVHTSHTLQEFNNGKNLLEHRLFLFISPENTNLWLSQKTKVKIFQRNISLILSPAAFNSLSLSIRRDKRENSVTTGLGPGIQKKMKQGKQQRKVNRRTSWNEAAWWSYSASLAGVCFNFFSSFSLTSSLGSKFLK